MAENFEGKGRSEIECPTWSMEVETVVVVRRFHRVSEGPVALEIDRRNHMDLLEAHQSSMASETVFLGRLNRENRRSIVTGRRGQAWIHQRADGYLLRSIAGD